MKSERIQTALVAGALIVVAVVAWSFELRPALVVDASELATLPRQIGSWDSVEIPVEETVEALLRADFNLQRIYVHPLGDRIEVYVGYYGTDRGGRPEHTPLACYPSGGWEILEDRSVWVDRESGLRAVELLVTQGTERHLVHFWYRSHRTTGLLGPVDQIVDRFVSRLTGSRSDGALIRVSTPIPRGDQVAARSRLLAFAATLDPLVGERWPHETPSQG